MQLQVAERAARSRFVEPKAIPETLAGGESEDGSSSERDEKPNVLHASIASVVNVAKQRLVLPALRLENDDDYLQFWLDNSEAFKGFMQTLDALTGAALVCADNPPSLRDRRARFFEKCIRAAELLVEDGASLMRGAFADSLAAYAIVKRFPSLATLDDAEDATTSRIHNVILEILDPLFVSVYESAKVTVPAGLKRSVVELPAVLARQLYDLACTAAARRHVSTAYDIEWAQSAWSEPCADLLEYLEHRAPELVTDTLRELCAGGDELATLVARLNGGKSIARDELKALAATHQQTGSSSDVKAWAETLARDLAAHQD